MKKISLMLVLFLLVVIVKSQNSKLSLGIIGSPDYNFLEIEENELTNFSYKPCIGYSTGLVIKYNFSEKMSAKTGILYSDKSFKVNWDWQLIDGIPDPAIPDNSKMETTYFDFPLLVSYNFIVQNKLTYYISSGLTYSYLLNYKEISIMQDGKEKETDFLNSMYDFPSSALNLELESGLKYEFNNQLSLTLEPYYRYVINKVSNEFLKSNQSSLGIRLSLNFNVT